MTSDLTFRGTRFPKAKTKATARGDFLAADGTKLPNARPVYSVFAGGDGKPWSARTAEGHWRDLVPLDLRDADQIARYVKRRGLLFARSDGTLQEFTESWWGLQESLARIAAAWEPPDADGTSVISDNRKQIAAAENYQRDAFAVRLLFEDVRTATVIGEDGPALVREAQTLAGFLLGSAMLGLQNRTPMRQCDFCGTWFNRMRSDARFCCPSHRTQHYIRTSGSAVNPPATLSRVG